MQLILQELPRVLTISQFYLTQREISNTCTSADLLHICTYLVKEVQFNEMQETRSFMPLWPSVSSTDRVIIAAVSVAPQAHLLDC